MPRIIVDPLLYYYADCGSGSGIRPGIKIDLIQGH